MTATTMMQQLLVHPRTHQWLRVLGPASKRALLFSEPTASTATTTTTTSTTWNLLEEGSRSRKTSDFDSTSCSCSPQGYYRLQLGLTQRGLDDVGDLSRVERLVNTGGGGDSSLSSSFRRGQVLLKLHHEGHAITSADELYHTTWETVAESLTIVAPVTGQLESILTSNGNDTSTDNDSEDGDDYYVDDETVLLDMIASREDVDATLKGSETEFVKELDYFTILQSLPPGKFAEQD